MGKNAIKNHSKNKTETKGYEFAIMLVERAIETKENIKKRNGSQKVSRIDVLFLIEELKDDFKRINKKQGKLQNKR